MDSVARERRALEFDLRSALEGEELELFYQPLMSSSDSAPVGFEALLRWNHPIRGRPNRLELEITESLLIDRPDEVLATLQRLKDLGVSIAMDDFGTGYSSLSYLLKFPFDKIKIDKSFISAIDTDKAACDVLRTIGSLGKSLNIRITAEGVETEEQADFLRAIACDQLQGYFFAKPLQVSGIPAFLAKQTARKMRASEILDDQKMAAA
ncbi:unnamed protein product [Darwinula stevensoni]|uniref:EAL domain-containing protein n=1 Tax=Darwinula stevensoni TaxID=69355 RepID=A0A7R9AK23_9CRUS|nr:unnamed protein product [Darwinula stevensoni]CAG0908664.1 unnamed protein product [Darwinula stevensoni]